MSRVFCNKLEILDFVDTISKSQSDLQIKDWVSSNVKNFLLKKYKGVKIVNKNSINGILPKQECKTIMMAIKNDEPIYSLNISQNLRNEVLHVIDFLGSEKAPKTVVRLDYISARKHAKKWVDDLNNANKNVKVDEKKLNVIHYFKNGYKLIKLTTEEEFQEEGQKMKHCVSSYWGKQSETNLILSVRNSSNVSIATIELKLHKIIKNEKYSCIVTQFKGRSNIGMIDPSVARELDTYFKSTYKSVEWYDSSAFGPMLLIDGSSTRQYLALWPEGSVYKGNLDLSNLEIRMLPNKLTVTGNLDLTNCPISFLGNGLVVENNLTVHGSQVVVIDDTVKVGKILYGKNHSLLISYPESIVAF
jgi:hypothetical protein